MLVVMEGAGVLECKKREKASAGRITVGMFLRLDLVASSRRRERVCDRVGQATFTDDNGAVVSIEWRRETLIHVKA